VKRKIRNKIKISETDIKRQIKEYLDIMGWFNFPILQGIASYKGIPDRIAIKEGRILFLEIKIPKGKLSKWQQEFQTNIDNAGGEYYVVHNLDELIKVLGG